MTTGDTLRPRPDEIRLAAGEKTENPESWRQREPYAIFRRFPTIITTENILAGQSTIESEEEAEQLLRLLEPVRVAVFDGLAEGFQGRRESIYWYPRRDIKPEEREFCAVFNPVYIGPLANGVLEAFDARTLEEFKSKLRYATPEVRPLVKDIGDEMGLHGAHPNFVNLIFIQDNENRIPSLSADQKVALSRSFFAGLGSWKADIVTYSVDEQGKASLNGVMLTTLEGGHPFFGPEALDEVGWRHRVFASTKAVEAKKVPVTNESIKLDDWQNSEAVEGLRASGRELGRRGYLSESVHLSELVSDEWLGRLLGFTAGYAQQGEGALFARDPRLNKLVVSCTGQMGAMKADLKLNEVVAIVPMGRDQIGIVPVEGQGEPLKPSVEGPEFGFPVWELINNHPVWLDEQDGGYVITEAGEGRYTESPIRAGGHLHRGPVITASSRVVHLQTNPAEWPPVGCGVDASNEYSHCIFKRATQLWEDYGRQIEFVTYDVWGHSTNYLQFYVAGQVNHADHSKSLIEVLSSGELKFAHDVPQVEARLAT